jgi:hypothetical protein
LRLGNGARVVVPRAWQQIRYHGTPAPVAFPIVFLTDGRLVGRCVTGPTSEMCTGQDWFAPQWTTPTDGVLLDWVHVSIPWPATDHHFLPYVHAPRIMLAHRPAKIVREPDSVCPDGAAYGIHAYVQQSRAGYPGERLDMTACLGAQAPPVTRRAVMRMLHSLSFGRPR